MLACLEHVAMGTISTPMIYLRIITHIFSLIPRILLILLLSSKKKILAQPVPFLCYIGISAIFDATKLPQFFVLPIYI